VHCKICQPLTHLCTKTGIYCNSAVSFLMVSRRDTSSCHSQASIYTNDQPLLLNSSVTHRAVTSSYRPRNSLERVYVVGGAGGSWLDQERGCACLEGSSSLLGRVVLLLPVHTHARCSQHCTSKYSDTWCWSLTSRQSGKREGCPSAGCKQLHPSPVCPPRRQADMTTLHIFKDHCT
jgi:hypothetical protein